MEHLAAYFLAYGRITRGKLFFRIIIVAILGIAFGSLADAIVGNYGSGFFASLALWCAGALLVQRLHDTGRSGWFLLLAYLPVFGPIFLLIQFCQRGAESVNRFGDDPTARTGYLTVDISR